MTTPARYADGTPYLSHGVDAAGRPFALLVHQGSAALTRDQLVELRTACEAALSRFAVTEPSRHRSQVGSRVAWGSIEPFHLYVGAEAEVVNHVAIASMWLADDQWRTWSTITPSQKRPLYGGPGQPEVIDNDFVGTTMAEAKDRFWRWCDENPSREVAKVLRRPMPYHIAASATCTIPIGGLFRTDNGWWGVRTGDNQCHVVRGILETQVEYREFGFVELVSRRCVLFDVLPKSKWTTEGVAAAIADSCPGPG